MSQGPNQSSKVAGQLSNRGQIVDLVIMHEYWNAKECDVDHVQSPVYYQSTLAPPLCIKTWLEFSYIGKTDFPQRCSASVQQRSPLESTNLHTS